MSRVSLRAILLSSSIFIFVKVNCEATLKVFVPRKILRTQWNTDLVESNSERLSKLICAANCATNLPDCNSFFYDEDTNNCQLSTKTKHYHIDESLVLPIFAIVFIEASATIAGASAISKFQLRTGTEYYDNGGTNCQLYLRVCHLDGTTCCDSQHLGGPGETYDHDILNTYEGAVLDTCKDFMVPDYTKAHIYVRHSGTDGWGGQYVNLWFDANQWFAKCVNPTGEKIWVVNDGAMRLECSPGDINNI